MTVHFTPAGAGGWQALCAGPRLLVLGATVTPERLDALWSAVGDSGGFQTVLDVLTSEGLSATPPFALLDGEDSELRVVLRGDVVATVSTASGEHGLEGAGVSTWLEKSLTGVASASLSVPAAAVIEQAGVLPLRDGAAWIARIDYAPGEAVPVLPRPKAAVVTPPVAEAAASAAFSEATVTEVAGLLPAAEETAFRVPGDQASAVPAAPAVAAAVLEGDHDGHTVMTSDIAKLRAGRKTPSTPAPPGTATATATAPSLVLAVSTTGAREPLTQPILVGRAPSVSKVSGDQIPRLLTVGTADQDISRNHARFALEGGTVVVTDLHSRNGTMIVLPGKGPQKLRAGEPTSVIVGTVIDLGGGVTLTVDED